MELLPDLLNVLMDVKGVEHPLAQFSGFRFSKVSPSLQFSGRFNMFNLEHSPSGTSKRRR